MTRREELQEAYEDAMFALLMDYVAESEGKRPWRRTAHSRRIRTRRSPRRCAGRV